MLNQYCSLYLDLPSTKLPPRLILADSPDMGKKLEFSLGVI